MRSIVCAFSTYQVQILGKTTMNILNTEQRIIVIITPLESLHLNIEKVSSLTLSQQLKQVSEDS